jgi:hypothetical protein
MSDSRIDVNSLIKNCLTSAVPKKCPVYESTRGLIATRVLADPFFYYNKPSWALDSWKWRRHYLRDKTIEQIANDYPTTKERQALAQKIQSYPHLLEEYFGQRIINLEKVVCYKIIDLSGSKDIERVRENYTSIGSWNLLLWKSLPVYNRTSDIIYILGPGGSGKTFLATKQAAECNIENPRRTVYMNFVQSRVPYTKETRGEDRFDWITSKMKAQFPFSMSAKSSACMFHLC